MTETTVQRYDTLNMRKLLVEFPRQIEDAVRIDASTRIPINGSSLQNIVVTGLGGSAIGGDILRSYVAEEIEIPFVVNRHYFLPEFVGKKSLVVVSSYSGGTEETIAAHLDAKRRKASVLCIASGGETEQLARKFRQPFVKIPKGYPPRTALGYSFFVPLLALIKMKILGPRNKEINETVKLLRRKAKVYASLTGRNPAYEIAKQLYNRLPIIYSSADRLDAINVRWRGQLAENAKVLAFGNVLPEMNHNELVGWRVLRRHMNEMAVVFLRDKAEHPRVRARIEITRSIVNEFTNRAIDASAEGTSLLARMFSLIYLGDWTSYYLALLNGIDPTPVRIIDYLKWEMGKR
ncbi:MAG TPA: bifunctional phosphoglucose/phosphomannose isomerase [Bacteroidota bacterium]|jgi:glucose/mannose-6-phosphate isomerase|nr:bifunctional phosphoglucose/phosphomannose isomerase [Bacteroidota bacterium]